MAAEPNRESITCYPNWQDKMDMEYFEIVDENNRVIGTARRSECHGNPSLVHRTAHVLVINSQGQLYLQKRSCRKDIQPGKWDTSVGGHLEVGETPEQAAYRELAEELGITQVPLEYRYDFKIRNDQESENVSSFLARYDGPIRPDPGEIEQGRFWDIKEIQEKLGSGIFTPSFEKEFSSYLQWTSR